MTNKLNLRNAAMLAGALFVSFGAMADQPDGSVQIQTRTVKFNRAAAATPVGAVELYSSLNQAVVRVCVDSSEPLALQSTLYLQCRDTALARAIDQVGIDAVSALHSRDGRTSSRKGTVTTESLNQ